ncbi:MAG: DNA-binding transcriptional MerR regulator [Bradymonadia bacterium]|jgi:DNA-binding transcriptional MerR regulator
MTADAIYPIRTLSERTGVPVNTLRTWERRHGLLDPARTAGGDRRYGEADVERVHLVQASLKSGLALGSMATLDNDALRARLRPKTHAQRAIVVGPRLSARYPIAAAIGDANVVASATDLAGAQAENRQADLLVVELESLPEAAAVAGARSSFGARRVIVLYDFAPAAERLALAQAGAELLRAPFTAESLARIVGLPRPEPTPNDEGPAPAPRFSVTQLARLGELEAGMACACPQHLSEVVIQLAAFERYSLRCLDIASDDDEMHRELALETGRARARMEALLERLCAYEGIDPRGVKAIDVTDP